MTFLGSEPLTYWNNPTVSLEVNDDDDATTMAFGTRYIFNNNGSTPSATYQLDLPLQTAQDAGKKIWVHTRYDNDPNDDGNFGVGAVKTSGSDTITWMRTAEDEIELLANDDNIAFVADGAGEWTME